MLAIDTNVLVRCLVDEDPDQCRRARALVAGNKVFVSRTVLLEAEWVLRGGLRLPRKATLVALRDFLDLPTVTAEAFAATLRALEFAEQGMDFADALHLTGSPEADGFVTFDKKMLGAAIKAGVENVREP